MAYSSSSAISPIDLLQKLVTWLVTIGWTNNMSQAEGSGWRAHLTKGTKTVNLRAIVGEGKQFTGAPTAVYFGILIYTGTGFSGASAWKAQVGGPLWSGTANTIGAFMPMPNGAVPSYHFMDDGADNVLVVVEYSAGNFHNMGWGELVKSGAFTGGSYFGASAGVVGASTGFVPGCPFSDSKTKVWGEATTFFRADVDAFTGKWLAGTDSTGAVTGKTAYSPITNYNINARVNYNLIPNYALDAPTMGFDFQAAQVSTQNQQINLLPCFIFAGRDDYGVSLLGSIPNVFYTNACDRGFDKASTLQIGGDSYLLFPDFAVKKVV